jgi:hypothetical protein
MNEASPTFFTAYKQGIGLDYVYIAKEISRDGPEATLKDDCVG